MSQSIHISSNDDSSAEVFSAKPIFKLFEKKHAALWHAARLLGGYDASRIVDRCADLLDANRSITNQVWIMLEQIAAILSLEMAEDPEKPYMGFFAVIDPSDPVVDEICLLTDELQDAMEQVIARRAWAQRSPRQDAA